MNRKYRSRRFFTGFVMLSAMVLFALGLGSLYYQTTRVIEIFIPSTRGNSSPGTVYTVEQIGNYRAFMFKALLWWADLPEEIAVHNGAKLYRVQYWTKRHDGIPVIVSGLVAIPASTSFRGVVSYQHGTNVNRHATPSQPSLGEGVLGSAIFAGGGYIFVAPDYTGLGVSTETHTYLHAESTADAVIDLLRAASRFIEFRGQKRPSSLFLTGFSQGGHATLATQRTLEKMDDPNLQVAASAPVSGPCNLDGISFPTALEGASPAHSLYLAYLVNSYCNVYGSPVESVLAAPYAALVPELFDGEGSVEAIMAALPCQPRDMFNSVFLEDYDRGKPTTLLDMLSLNEVMYWSPEAPLRLYFGENDQDVSPKEAHAAVAEFERRGSDAILVSVGPYGHDESIFRAIPKIRAWFDDLSSH